MNKKEELKEELKVEYDAESGERNDLEEDQDEIEENDRILTDEELTQRKNRLRTRSSATHESAI